MPRIAAVQMETTLLDIEANSTKILEFISRAVAHDAQIVVFPECALTGYNLTLDEAEELAVSIPGAQTELITNTCAHSGILVVVGTIERGQDGRLYNSAVLINSDGVLGIYRKTHLPMLGIDRFLSPGDAIPEPFSTEYGRLGMLICYDVRFPEPIRVLSLAETQIVLIPTAWPDKASLYPDFVVRTRAEENHVYIAAANHVGEERGVRYLGRSLITSPSGKIMAEGTAAEEEILYADIELELSDEKRIIFSAGEYELDLFGDRRPELYGRIVEEEMGD
jgi:predicted amidohydrolase